MSKNPCNFRKMNKFTKVKKFLLFFLLKIRKKTINSLYISICVLNIISVKKKFGFRPRTFNKYHFRKCIFNVMNGYIFYPEKGFKLKIYRLSIKIDNK